MDPPDHTRHRLLTGQFTTRRMQELEPRIEQVTNDCPDAMEQAGPPADLVSAFALPIPSLVIRELLGVPSADRQRSQDNTATLARLEAATAAGHHPQRSSVTTPRAPRPPITFPPIRPAKHEPRIEDRKWRHRGWPWAPSSRAGAPSTSSVVVPAGAF